MRPFLSELWCEQKVFYAKLLAVFIYCTGLSMRNFLIFVALVFVGFALFATPTQRNSVMSVFRSNDLAYQCFNFHRNNTQGMSSTSYKEGFSKGTSVTAFYTGTNESGMDTLSSVACTVNGKTLDTELALRQIQQQASAEKTKQVEKPKQVSRTSADKYEGKISDYALSPYTKSGYPKTVAVFGSRLPEIEKLRRKAAEISIDDGSCSGVSMAELSTSKSTLQHLQFWVDCEDNSRVTMDEFQISTKKP
jgi:hypothetical protein